MPPIRACALRRPKQGLIVHTDGGAQYDSWSMRREYLKRHIQHSVSRPGTPTDNLLIESLNSSLKSELLNTHFFRGEAELFERLAEHIDFYNDQRIHEDLNDLSPTEFEQKVVSVKSPV